MREVLSTLAGILSVVALFPYVRSVLRGQTKPIKASWLIWLINNILVMLGMYYKGVLNGLIVGSVIGNLVVLTLSFRYGESGWTRLDKICLGGAAIGIGLWQVMNSPLLGMLAGLSVSSIGALPTFVSAWKFPEWESKTAWSIVWCGSVCAVMGVRSWTFVGLIQPIVFGVLQTIMIFLVVVRPCLKRWWMYARREA